MKIFQIIRCAILNGGHQFAFRNNLHGDRALVMGARSVWACTKCPAVEYRQEVHEDNEVPEPWFDARGEKQRWAVEQISLRFSIQGAHENGETRHAQEVMRALGITYAKATPQSMADQWWFWNCENVPAELPAFLSRLDLKPHKAIGHGLSKADADMLDPATAASPAVDPAFRRETAQSCPTCCARKGEPHEPGCKAGPGIA